MNKARRKKIISLLAEASLRETLATRYPETISYEAWKLLSENNEDRSTKKVELD